MEAKDLFQKHTLACLAGGFALGVIVLGIGAAFNSISGSPEFCGTCHAMKGEAASFKEGYPSVYGGRREAEHLSLPPRGSDAVHEPHGGIYAAGQRRRLPEVPQPYRTRLQSS